MRIEREWGRGTAQQTYIENWETLVFFILSNTLDLPFVVQIGCLYTKGFQCMARGRRGGNGPQEFRQVWKEGVMNLLSPVNTGEDQFKGR